MKKLFIALIFLSGLSCQKKCDSCINESICAHETCYCLNGYDGQHCENKFAPDFIVIDSLEITRFPKLENDTLTWDFYDDLSGGSEPDIRFHIIFYDTLEYPFGHGVQKFYHKYSKTIWNASIDSLPFTIAYHDPIPLNQLTNYFRIYFSNTSNTFVEESMGYIGGKLFKKGYMGGSRSLTLESQEWTIKVFLKDSVI